MEEDMAVMVGIVLVILIIVSGFVIGHKISVESKTEYLVCVSACNSYDRPDYALKADCIKSCEGLSECNKLSDANVLAPVTEDEA